MTQSLTIAHADPLGRSASRLLQLMSIEAKCRYPEDWPDGAQPPRNQPLQPRSAFLIARLDDRVAGCVGIRPLEDDIAELRRMYVVRRRRRNGVARGLLHEIESLARGFGFRAIRLETGVRQPEAIAFYESEGYVGISSYGTYASDPFAVCYEKSLVI